MHIVTGNEKLCKIYFKKLFFQNVLAFIDLFIDTIISVISSTQIACDVMCVQYVQKQPPEVFLKILLISQENTCVGVSFLIKLQALRLQHRCVHVKLAKFYEHLF